MPFNSLKTTIASLLNGIALAFLIDFTIQELGSQAGTGEFYDGELGDLVMPSTTYAMGSNAASEGASVGSGIMRHIGVTWL